MSAPHRIAPQVVTAWLRVRRRVGWGAPAEEALALARMYFLAAAMTSLLAVSTIGLEALLIWHEHPKSLWEPSTLRLFALDAALFLALDLLCLVAGLFARRRGRRAKASLPQVIYGRCFDVFEVHANSWEGQKRERRLSARADRPVPLYLFVLVGPIEESARWYLLPSDWYDAVPEPDDQVTMEVQPYTDFVIRLNERNQYQLLESMAPAEQSQAEKPSRRERRQERREEKRAILRAGRGWGMTAAEAAKALRHMLWLTPFLLGTPAILLAFALFADWIVYRILAGAFALLSSWAVIGWVTLGYRLIEAWRRARQTPGPAQTVEGVITGFTPVNPSADEDEQRAIIWLERADGARTSLVLGPQLLNGSLLAGQRVRIRYLPPNDVVVAVQPTAESRREQNSGMCSS